MFTYSTPLRAEQLVAAALARALANLVLVFAYSLVHQLPFITM